MTNLPVCYPVSDAPPEMMIAAEKYEKKFDVSFDTITYFSKKMLGELHGASSSDDEIPDNVTVASHIDSSIVKDISQITDIVNNQELSSEQRKSYLAALKRIYKKLPNPPDDLVKDNGTLFVGPEREGRILAEQLGWLPAGRSIAPHAKRVLYKDGLLVGLSSMPEINYKKFSKCVIVDGAIASGSTIMTLIEMLRSDISDFRIYSVHGPYKGLRGISRYGELSGIKITISVGHATVGLNKKFYATVSSDPQKLVVGDLGDTISELFTKMKK